MAKLQNLVLVALAAIFCHAEGSVAEGNIQILENRAAYYGGLGLQLQLTEVCPTGTYSCQEQISPGQQVGGPCCPDATWCDSGTAFCCPTSQDCSSNVAAGPTCADPSWNLLNDGSGNAICCYPGEGAVSGGQCLPSSYVGMQTDTAYTTETQANSASPTGDHTVSGGAAAATTSSAGGGGSTPSSSPGGFPSQGSASPTIAAGSTPTGAGTTASATKKSAADKNFVAGGSVLVCLLALVPQLF